MRTVIAFLVAPCAAPLLYAAVAITRRPPTAGSTWLSAFAQHFSHACVISYPISMTFGTLVFLVLKKVNRESVGAYALIGALGGFLPIASLGIGQHFTSDMFVIGGVFALLGLSVSTCFALIKGVPRRPSRQSNPS